MKHLSSLLIGLSFLTAYAYASDQGEEMLRQANENAQRELARQITAQDMPEQNKKLMAILQAAYNATDPGVEFIDQPDTDPHAAFRRAFDKAKEACANPSNVKICNNYLRLANDKLVETKSVAVMTTPQTGRKASSTPTPARKGSVPGFTKFLKRK